jgi:hypothetical protein
MKSMVSVESQPFSSCAIVNAAITAECLWLGGYLAAALSTFASDSGDNIIGAFMIYGQDSQDFAGLT